MTTSRKEFLKRGLAGGAALALYGSLPKQAVAAKPQPDPESLRVSVGLRNAMLGQEKKFPLLARALRDPRKMYSTRVEWIGKSGKAVENWSQIYRVPWTITNTQAATRNRPAAVTSITRKKSIEMLEQIERGLMYGVPSCSTVDDWYPRQQMGGAKHYLGRRPRSSDTFDLCILRDLVLHTNVQAPDLDARTDEWICEVSVMAR